MSDKRAEYTASIQDEIDVLIAGYENLIAQLRKRTAAELLSEVGQIGDNGKRITARDRVQALTRSINFHTRSLADVNRAAELFDQKVREPLPAPVVEEKAVQAQYANVQQATVQTKKLCREENVSIVSANSQYLPCGKQMQTFIHMHVGASDATYAKLVAVLTTAGYTSVRVHSNVGFVSVCSNLRNA